MKKNPPSPYDMHAKLATLRVQRIIEKASAKAKERLKLPFDATALSKKLAEIKKQEPLYVAQIVISGKTLHEMYDEHPGLGYFTSDEFRNYLPSKDYCGLQEGMREAEALFLAHQNEIEQSDKWHEGYFQGEYVILMSQTNEVIQMYGDGWVKRQHNDQELEKLKHQIKELMSDSAMESRWDNFDSARRLREKATFLENYIMVLENAPRVFP